MIHGNAQIERGFRINGNIITENCSGLSELSINSLRLVHNGIKFFGSDSMHKAT